MAKKPKKIQTDYTRGGRDVSNTAVPIWQNQLRGMDDYNANPQRYIDDYRDKYFTDTVVENDFMRDYNRAMSNAAARNYAGTQGGYSSAGQLAYDDTQRYQNDLARRVYEQGLDNAASMAQQHFNNLIQGANTAQNAYGAGKEYSDIEQYNNMVKQHNKFGNQLAGVVGGVGSVLSKIPNPWTQGIGAAMQIGGDLGSVDTSGVLGATRGAGSTGNLAGAFGGDNIYDSIAKGIIGTMDVKDKEKLRKQTAEGAK